jgi:hypothetical protein
MQETNLTTVLGVYLVLNSRFVAEWSVENMNPDVCPYRMSLDASVSPKKKKEKKGYNKQLILIRLFKSGCH